MTKNQAVGVLVSTVAGIFAMGYLVGKKDGKVSRDNPFSNSKGVFSTNNPFEECYNPMNNFHKCFGCNFNPMSMNCGNSSMGRSGIFDARPFK